MVVSPHSPHRSARARLLCAGLLVVCMIRGVACAQTVAAANPGGSSADSAGGDALGEVVVTARRRSENLINVPLSVTALSGAELEKRGDASVGDLIGSVPSLFTTQNQTFGPAPSQTYLVIRGVGATSSSDPAVGTFVDGVYQPSLGFDSDLMDVERVEVLRGPQGALFGRNTEGGAVSITTRTPGNDFGGRLTAEMGSFDSYKVGANITGPLVEDRVYGSASLGYAHTNGFLENITLGRPQDNSDKYAARFALRLTPVEDLEMILRASLESERLGYVGFGVPDDGTERYVTLDDQKHTSKLENYGTSATINYKWHDITLTSITGASKIHTHYWFDYDSSTDLGNFQDQLTSQQLFSQELRAAGSIGKQVDWLVGYYYFKERYDQARDFGLGECSICTAPPIFSYEDVVLEQTRFFRHGNAGFGHLIYRPIDNLDLTAGARYSSERVTARQAGNIHMPYAGVEEHYDGTNSSTFNNFSPSGTVAYHWTPRLTSYLTVSRGFRPGGYDKYPGSAAGVGIPFRSETSTNYEGGVKTEMLERRLYVQADVFYVTVQNQQLVSTIPRPITGVPVGVETNVGNSSSRGVEFEANYAPVRAVRLSANASYVDAVFDKLIYAVGSHEVGDALPYVPRWTASGSAEFTQAVENDSSLTYGAYFRFVGAHYNGNGAPPFDPILDIPSVSILDLKVTWRKGPCDVSAFVNNVTDRFAIVSRYQPAFEPYTRASVLPPRAFGVRASYEW